MQPLGRPYELVPLVTVARAVADVALDYERIGPIRAVLGEALRRKRCSVSELIAEYERGPRNRSRLFRLRGQGFAQAGREILVRGAAVFLGDLLFDDLALPILVQGRCGGGGGFLRSLPGCVGHRGAGSRSIGLGGLCGL